MNLKSQITLQVYLNLINKNEILKILNKLNLALNLSISVVNYALPKRVGLVKR